MKLDTEQLGLISKALADPKRFEILERIATAKEPPNCSCMREWTGLSAATVSHHLKELDNAGLVSVERNGKFANVLLRRDVWQAYLKRLAEI